MDCNQIKIFINLEDFNMKNLDCNQINIFINLEIIGEEDKNNIYKYRYIYLFFFNITKFLQFG